MEKEHTENKKRLLIGLTMNGDSDLLHLSEGISNDLSYFYNTIDEAGDM